MCCRRRVRLEVGEKTALHEVLLSSDALQQFLHLLADEVLVAAGAARRGQAAQKVAQLGEALPAEGETR